MLIGPRAVVLCVFYAAALVSGNSTDEYEQQAKLHVNELIRMKFGGDWRACFRHYERNGDGSMEQDEIYGVFRHGEVCFLFSVLRRRA